LPISFDELQVGQSFQDPGFVSTSFDEKAAREWYGGMVNQQHDQTNPYQYLLKIEAPKGTPAISIDSILHRHTEEVVLGRNLTFTVIERDPVTRTITVRVSSTATNGTPQVP
jgi:hypothetical protein